MISIRLSQAQQEKRYRWLVSQSLAQGFRNRNGEMLTDKGKKLTDRFCTNREHHVSGNHKFDQLCQAFHMEHHLTKHRTPKTNALVELFTGRIFDVLKTRNFTSIEDL
jgi:hypothetical protein